MAFGDVVKKKTGKKFENDDKEMEASGPFKKNGDKGDLKKGKKGGSFKKAVSNAKKKCKGKC